MKTYYYQFGVGSTRHSISFHDGVTTHKDGSPFFDLRLFGNKREMARFCRALKADGYVEKR